MRVLPAALWFLALVSTQSGRGTETNRLPAHDIAAARKIYVAKCAKCHKFYDPAGYTESEWRRWMDSMSRKSKLKPEQDKLLGKYLDAYRAGTLAIPK